MKNEGMKEEQKRLKQLPMDYLWEGLILKDDVYNYNGTVLLIPAGAVIDSLRLRRLDSFSGKERFVMTTERSFEQIMTHREVNPRGTQQQIEDNSGYTDLKKNVDNMLDEVRHTKQVRAEQAIDIARETFEVMEARELSVMLNCIDTPRPMDEQLQRHSLNVAILNGMIAKSLGLDKKQTHDLVLAGLLHDVGKTMVPQEILDAPRKLTEKEYAVVKKHPEFSYQIIGEDVAEEVRLAALYHHERVNGKGYPYGMKDKIPLYARITAVSDVYEALVAKRSYKEERIPFDVLNKLAEEKFGLDHKATMTLINHMVRELRGKEVLMSDNSEGQVCFVPPNDIEYPIVQANGKVRQTDDEWKCIRFLS